MRRGPRDRDDDPFEDMFRLMDRLMTDVAENMDRMMGPYGNVDFDVNRQFASPEREDAGTTTETHVDVQEDDEEIRVVADLPGVSDDDIDVKCDGRTLWITAQGERREYDEQIRLPAEVNELTATAAYNNGILEVTLARKDGGSGGTTIQVE